MYYTDTTDKVTQSLQLKSMYYPIIDVCRCHTFGIGSEVCIELVTGIAAISGGRCVLLKEGERLQSNVSVKSQVETS